jgi:hypothetical protein
MIQPISITGLSPELQTLVSAINQQIVSGINNGGIDSDCLAPGAVVRQKIEKYTIGNEQLGDQVIDSININLAQIQTAHIEDAAITNAKIGNAEIDDAKISDLSADKITAGTIDASVIDVTNLDASNVTAGTLSADYISGGTINGTTVNVVNLNAAEITVGKINGSQIDDYTINVSNINQTLSDATITAGSGYTYTNINLALQSLPQVINHAILIEGDGTSDGVVTVPKFTGAGSVTVKNKTGTACTASQFILNGVDVDFTLDGFTLSPTGGNFAVTVNRCDNVVVQNITTTNTGTPSRNGISISSARVYIYNCTISNKLYAITVGALAQARIQNLSGTGNSIYSNNGVLLNEGGHSGEFANLTGLIVNSGIFVPTQGAKAKGLDEYMITGTPGANGYLALWNADSDLVTAGVTLSGADNKAITGTPGTSGNFAAWNADGDLVDAGQKIAAYAATMPALSASSFKSVDVDISGGNWASAPKIFPVQAAIPSGSQKLNIKVDSANVTTTSARIYVYTGDGTSVTCSSFPVWLLAVGQ